MKANSLRCLTAALVVFTLMLTPAGKANAQHYTRPTVSLVLVKSSKSSDKRIDQTFFKTEKQAQFFYNRIALTTVPFAKNWGESHYPKELAVKLAGYLNEQNAGLQQLSAWFNRRTDGSMDMELVHWRGEYNASDAALQLVQATKRGRGELKNMGEQLIANTYIMVYDYTGIEYELNSKNEYHKYTAQGNMYLYRIAHPEQAVADVYDCWIEEEDTPEVRQRKNERYQALKVPVAFVSHTPFHFAVPASTNPKSSKYVSRDSLFRRAVATAVSRAIAALSNNDMHFAVQMPVFSVKPITAKAGTKEGLTGRQRFFVYETVQDDDSTIRNVRRGIVRVNGSHIADNSRITDGNTPVSRFFQIQGRRLEPGMSLVNANDFKSWNNFRLVGGGGLRSDGMTAIVARLEYRLWRGLFSTGFSFALLDAEFHNGAYTMRLPGGDGKQSLNSFTITLGAGHDIHCLRNLRISPYVAGGFSNYGEVTVSHSDPDVKDRTTLTVKGGIIGKAGVDFAYNLYYPFAIAGGIYGYYGTAVSTKLEKGDVAEADLGVAGKDPFADIRNNTYDYFFPDGGPSARGFGWFLGIRIAL